jgi:hypothetical protein
MISLFIWILISYGLTNIVVFSKIFEPLRNSFYYWGNNIFKPFNKIGKFLYGMTDCVMCFAVWAGFFLSFVLFSPTYYFIGLPIWASWFFDGIFSSGIVWIINSIVEFFEENRINKEE